MAEFSAPGGKASVVVASCKNKRGLNVHIWRIRDWTYYINNKADLHCKNQQVCEISGKDVSRFARVMRIEILSTLLCNY